MPASLTRITDDALFKVAAAAFFIMLAVKLVLISYAPVVWDEAHHWVTGQRLALGYNDITPGPAYLARLGTDLFGINLWGLRFLPLLLAAGIPFAVYFLAIALVPRREALWAAILSLFLPATGLHGVISYPEGGLQLLALLTLGAAVRAVKRDDWRIWVLVGLGAGLGAFWHYRFYLFPLGFVIFLLATPAGRAQFQKPGLYLAGVLAFLGVLPTLVHILTAEFSPLNYHVGGRHETNFDANGLLHTFEQMGVVTPVFFAGLVGALVIAWKRGARGEAAAGLIAISSLTVLGAYTVLAPFNDEQIYHWPVSGYAPLLVFLPAAFLKFINAATTGKGRKARVALVALAPVIGLAGMAWSFYALAAWKAPDRFFQPQHQWIMGGDFEDWSQAKPDLDKHLAGFETPPILVGDHHILSVQMRFADKDAHPFYTLAHPRDATPGFSFLHKARATGQEALTAQQAGREALVILEEPTYLYHQPEEAAFRQSACGRFEDVEFLGLAELPPGFTAVEFYRAKVRPPEAVEDKAVCAFLPTEYVGQPFRGKIVEPNTNVFGIAAWPGAGVGRAEILLNGEIWGEARLHIDSKGFEKPDVFPGDPDFPNVEYVLRLTPDIMPPPGRHRYAVRYYRRDGTMVESGHRWIFVR